jgi:hypothetical protein
VSSLISPSPALISLRVARGFNGEIETRGSCRRCTPEHFGDDVGRSIDAVGAVMRDGASGLSGVEDWPTIGPHTAGNRRLPATTRTAVPSSEASVFVVVSCLGFIYGIAFDSRWRYQKSRYLARVFRAFGGRECLNSNGRLTESGRRSSGHDLPERLRRLATAAGLHYSDLF